MSRRTKASDQEVEDFVAYLNEVPDRFPNISPSDALRGVIGLSGAAPDQTSVPEGGYVDQSACLIQFLDDGTFRAIWTVRAIPVTMGNA